jgi:tetratricopeptide (TPR) repeat protein
LRDASSVILFMHMRTKFLIWLGCLLLLAVAGCSRQSKEAKYLKQAESFFTAGDYDRAEIDYLNVLRLNRTNMTAVHRLARIALDQGRLVMAHSLYAQAAKQWPEDFETRLRLASLRLPAGRTAELHAEAAKLAGLQPTNAEALALWVDSLPATNDLVELQQRLAKLESAAGRAPGYHVASGTLLLRQRDFAAAEGAFRRALELDAKHGKAHLGLAALALLRQDKAGAEREFKAAAELAPPRSTDGLRYADFLAGNGNIAAARAWLEGVAKKTPDFLPAIVRLAQLALAERRHDDGERLLKQVLARDAAQLDALLLLARLRLAQNAPDKAVAELENALKTFPRLPQLHQQLAAAHLAAGNVVDATKRLNEALALQPDYPEAALLLAEVSLRRGDAQAAADVLTQLLQRRPNDMQAQLLLASAYQGQGDLAGALKVYEQLGRHQPSNAQPALLQGMVLNRLGRPREAQASFERALAINPDYLPAAELLVFMDIAGNRFNEAQERAQRFAERAPAQAAPRVLLAKALIARTNFPAAEQALLKAVELAPDSRDAQWWLARLYVLEKENVAALEKLQQLAARNTNDVAVWMQIADLHTAGTNHTAAAQAYERVLSVQPKSGPALNNLAWLLAEHLGDPKRAGELADRARDLMPDNPATADTVGWVAFRNGDYPRALGLLKESAQKLGNHPEVLFHLGMTHYMMGEEVPARIALENSAQLAPDAPWRGVALEKLQILGLSPATGGAELVAQLERLRAKSPDDPLLHLRLAAALQRVGDWKQAMAMCEKAVALNGNLSAGLIELARLSHYQAGDSARALELARRARALDASSPIIAHLLGKLSYDTARTPTEFQLALGLLQAGAAARPDDAEMLFDHARALYAVGQASNAVAQLRRAASLQPASPWTRSAVDFLEMDGLRLQPEASAAAAAKVQALAAARPPVLPALLASGQLLEQAGDKPAARATYERILLEFPLFAMAHEALARLLEAAPFNDTAKAYEHASKARAAYPADPSIARLLGGLAFQRGEFSRAAQLLTECAPAFAGDADLHYDLGFAYQKLKQTAPARGALNKALELAPSSARAEPARRALAELK